MLLTQHLNTTLYNNLNNINEMNEVCIDSNCSSALCVRMYTHLLCVDSKCTRVCVCVCVCVCVNLILDSSVDYL